ncbi:hypothetical protein DSUL_50306 [Desulfovibrionales bacterium]
MLYAKLMSYMTYNHYTGLTHLEAVQTREYIITKILIVL